MLVKQSISRNDNQIPISGIFRFSATRNADITRLWRKFGGARANLTPKKIFIQQRLFFCKKVGRGDGHKSKAKQSFLMDEAHISSYSTDNITVEGNFSCPLFVFFFSNVA